MQSTLSTLDLLSNERLCLERGCEGYRSEVVALRNEEFPLLQSGNGGAEKVRLVSSEREAGTSALAPATEREQGGSPGARTDGELASAQGHVTYLDHAGTTLYSRSQIEAHARHLASAVYGNPHSRGPVAELTRDAVEEIRARILRFFGADPAEYAVVFTAGATAALKMVGELLPWGGISAAGDGGSGSVVTDLVYTMRNHTSVLGIREYARAGGAGVYAAHDLDAVLRRERLRRRRRRRRSGEGEMREEAKRKLTLQCTCLRPCDTGRGGGGSSGVETNERVTRLGLFVVPGECNWSGSKMDLSCIAAVRSQGLRVVVDKAADGVCDNVDVHGGDHHDNGNGGDDDDGEGAGRADRWLVLLDAAKLAATSPVNLSSSDLGISPDFVAVSFYKIFGFPSGLGALLVRREVAPLLRKVGERRCFSLSLSSCFSLCLSLSLAFSLFFSRQRVTLLSSYFFFFFSFFFEYIVALLRRRDDLRGRG